MPKKNERYENNSGEVFATKEEYLDWIKKISSDWEDCWNAKKQAEESNGKISYLFSEDE